VLVLALLAGACSLVRMTYPQLPTIAYWWLDGYADFDKLQSERVREQLADWMRWHRATQLDDYAALLQRARVEVLADTTPSRVCQWWELGIDKAWTGFDRALPAIAESALTLTPSQLDHVQRHFDKRNADLREEYLDPSPEKRLKEASKRVVDRAEMLYGRLDDAQRERITRGTAASPFDPERMLLELQRRQRDILDTLRRLQAERAGSDQMQAALRMLAERAQRSPDEAYRAYQRRLTQYGCAFAAQIHNATTPAQRQAAAATLAGWENDLRALAAEAAK